MAGSVAEIGRPVKPLAPVEAAFVPTTCSPGSHPVVFHDAGVEAGPCLPAYGEADARSAHGRARLSAAPVQKEVHPCT